MILEPFKIYTFDFTDQISFANIPREVLYKLFTDGRFASEPLSHFFDLTFDDLTYVDEKGYDFVHPQFPFIEQKQITKGGLKFCPSNMIGQGRSVQSDVVSEHIKNLDLHYLIPNIIDFPLIRVILLPGLELLEKCSTASCSFSKNDAIERLMKPYASAESK